MVKRDGYDRSRRRRSAPGCRVGRRSGGFSLIESLIAVTILGTVVLAVSVAVTTAQQVAFEGQKRMLAAIAADDILNELVTLDYAVLPTWDGTIQGMGEMTTIDGEAYPEAYWAVGREISVTDEDVYDEGLEVTVRGRRIVVAVTDEFGVIGTVETWVAEPSP